MDKKAILKELDKVNKQLIKLMKKAGRGSPLDALKVQALIDDQKRLMKEVESDPELKTEIEKRKKQSN